MSIALETTCHMQGKCMFWDTCLVNFPSKDTRTGQALQGEFEPSLKVRLVRTKKQIRCFSYTEKKHGGYNGRERY